MTNRQLVGRTVIVLSIVFLAWGLLWVLEQITDILILVLVSAILAAGLAPVVGFVERWRIPGGARLSRGVAIFLLYLAIFGLVTLIFSIILVPTVNEGARFAQQLPQLLNQIKGWLLHLQGQFPWLPDMAGTLDQLPSLVQSPEVSRLGSRAAGVAFRFLGGVASLITVLVFTFYMLLEGGGIKRAFIVLFPPSEQRRVILVLDRIGVKFGGWLRAQMLLSASVAIPVAIGLSLLRIPYPFLLAIIAGIGELIPMVGPTLGAAVAILVALSQQPWQLIGVIIFYVVVLNVEPHILVPRIMSQVIGMSPLLTLIALLSGIKLLGILGGLLAVPLAAALQVIISEVAVTLLPGSTALAEAAPPGPSTSTGPSAGPN